MVLYAMRISVENQQILEKTFNGFQVHVFIPSQTFIFFGSLKEESFQGPLNVQNAK